MFFLSPAARSLPYMAVPLLTTHSVGLWTSDRPVAETNWQQYSPNTEIHALGGIRTRNPNRRAAAGVGIEAVSHEKLPSPSIELECNW